MNISKKKILLICSAAIAIVVIGYFVFRKDSSSKPEFRTAIVEKGDIESTILSTGIVSPYNRLEIKPPVAGRMDEVLIEEGDLVRKGQIIGWMSSTERAALLDAARAKGEGEVKRWEEFYKATPIVAPLDGKLILRNVQPGQTVTNQDAILVLSDRLIVKGQVDETDIAQIKLKESARITLDAYSSDVIPGIVDHIVYEAKTVNNVTTYEVDVIPDQTPDFLRSGQTANITFVIDRKEGVLFVPSDAVQQKDQQSVVIAAGPKKKPEPRSVVTGISDGKKTEIVSGLNEGEKIFIPVARPKRPSANKGQTNPFAPNTRRR